MQKAWLLIVLYLSCTAVQAQTREIAKKRCSYNGKLVNVLFEDNLGLPPEYMRFGEHWTDSLKKKGSITRVREDTVRLDSMKNGEREKTGRTSADSLPLKTVNKDSSYQGKPDSLPEKLPVQPGQEREGKDDGQEGGQNQGDQQGILPLPPGGDPGSGGSPWLPVTITLLFLFSLTLITREYLQRRQQKIPT